jgi:iron complex transport system ATP-binding protein
MIFVLRDEGIYQHDETGQEVLELRDVSVRRGQRTILRPINFSITSGERWVVLRPNGAGKSTLI